MKIQLNIYDFSIFFDALSIIFCYSIFVSLIELLFSCSCFIYDLFVENGSEKAMEMLKRFAMKYYPNEQLADEEIAQAGRAVQMFEIEIEHMSGKEVQEK